VIQIEVKPIGKDLAEAIAKAGNQNELRFWWLGQAGFAFRFQETLILIDPYLSDSLAEKYKNSEFKHIRMMDPPLMPQDIRGCNWYLCTHGHTDHMDPGTISLVEQNSDPKFVIPRAEVERGLDRGIPSGSMAPINAGEIIDLDEGIQLEAIPSAHEALEVDSGGNHRYLGYILSFPDLKIYHAGDCIPYPGLASRLGEKEIDIAFLPINGRDEYRLSMGVPGNFTVEEAIQLCLDARIPQLVCHHFGMFSFNTIGREAAEAKLSADRRSIKWVLPECSTSYPIKLTMEKEKNGDYL